MTDLLDPVVLPPEPQATVLAVFLAVLNEDRGKPSAIGMDVERSRIRTKDSISDRSLYRI